MTDEQEPRLGAQKSAALERALVEYIRLDVVRAKLRRRRYTLAGAVAAILLTAGGFTAGAILWGSAPVTDTGIVHCFSRPEIGPDGSYPGSAVAVAGGGGEHIPIEDAVQACAVLWEQGVFDEDFDPATASPSPPRPIPEPLTVCVMRDGSAAVIPGPASVCQTLGLAKRESQP